MIKTIIRPDQTTFNDQRPIRKERPYKKYEDHLIEYCKQVIQPYYFHLLFCVEHEDPINVICIKAGEIKCDKCKILLVKHDPNKIANHDVIARFKFSQEQEAKQILERYLNLKAFI